MTKANTMDPNTFKKCIKKVAGDGLAAHATFPWRITNERVDAWIDAVRLRGAEVYRGDVSSSRKNVSFYMDGGAMASKFLARLQRVSGFTEAYVSGRVSLADALLLLGKGVEMFMDDGYTSITFYGPLTTSRLARLDALVARHDVLQGTRARFPLKRVDPESRSVLRDREAADRTIWLEGVFRASEATLLELIDNVSAVVEIRSGFTFTLDGIDYEYEHEVVGMEDPQCPHCGRPLEALAIDAGPEPVWGRGACDRCKTCYPLVDEGDSPYGRRPRLDDDDGEIEDDVEDEDETSWS